MKRQILIVADDRSFGETVSATVARGDCAVEWVQTGHEAVRRSLDRLFDAVVLDLQLVDSNGWMVLDCLCGLHPFLPIVALVESAEDGEVAKLIGAGAWLVKPGDGRLLFKVMQRLVAEPQEQRLCRSMAWRNGSLRLPERQAVFPA